MKTDYSQSDFNEMVSKITAFQKEGCEKFFKGMEDILEGKNYIQDLFPEYMADSLMDEGFSEYMNFVKSTFKRVAEINDILVSEGSKSKSNPFERFMKDMPDMPVKIMKKFLDIPPVGITRPYQEKINRVLEKLTVYNEAAGEFLKCTLVPLEESTRTKLFDILKKAESLKSADDLGKVYDEWLNLMEGEYQALFKTDRYKKILSKTFSALGEYRAASRELVLDLIHLAGLPFGRDMDDLSKEVFDLKKRIKSLEAQLGKTKAAPSGIEV